MLKTEPKYGVYPWWPEDGDDWLHPDDVALARTMIPGMRVFRREGTEGPFVVLRYGAVRLRVRSTLWQEVAHEGFDIDDWVEVRSRGRQNEPRTGIIHEILWRAPWKGLRYQVFDRDVLVETLYTAEDLRHVALTRPEELDDKQPS